MNPIDLALQNKLNTPKIVSKDSFVGFENNSSSTNISPDKDNNGQDIIHHKTNNNLYHHKSEKSLLTYYPNFAPILQDNYANSLLRKVVSNATRSNEIVRNFKPVPNTEKAIQHLSPKNIQDNNIIIKSKSCLKVNIGSTLRSKRANASTNRSQVSLRQEMIENPTFLEITSLKSREESKTISPRSKPFPSSYDHLEERKVNNNGSEKEKARRGPIYAGSNIENNSLNVGIKAVCSNELDILGENELEKYVMIPTNSLLPNSYTQSPRRLHSPTNPKTPNNDIKMRATKNIFSTFVETFPKSLLYPQGRTTRTKLLQEQILNTNKSRNNCYLRKNNTEQNVSLPYLNIDKRNYAMDSKSPTLNTHTNALDQLLTSTVSIMKIDNMKIKSDIYKPPKENKNNVGSYIGNMKASKTYIPQNKINSPNKEEKVSSIRSNLQNYINYNAMINNTIPVQDSKLISYTHNKYRNHKISGGINTGNITRSNLRIPYVDNKLLNISEDLNTEHPKSLITDMDTQNNNLFGEKRESVPKDINPAIISTSIWAGINKTSRTFLEVNGHNRNLNTLIGNPPINYINKDNQYKQTKTTVPAYETNINLSLKPKIYQTKELIFELDRAQRLRESKIDKLEEIGNQVKVNKNRENDSPKHIKEEGESIAEKSGKEIVREKRKIPLKLLKLEELNFQNAREKRSKIKPKITPSKHPSKLGNIYIREEDGKQEQKGKKGKEEQVETEDLFRDAGDICSWGVVHDSDSEYENQFIHSYKYN